MAFFLLTMMTGYNRLFGPGKSSPNNNNDSPEGSMMNIWIYNRSDWTQAEELMMLVMRDWLRCDMYIATNWQENKYEEKDRETETETETRETANGYQNATRWASQGRTFGHCATQQAMGNITSSPASYEPSSASSSSLMPLCHAMPCYVMPYYAMLSMLRQWVRIPT